MKQQEGVVRVGALGCGRIFNNAHRWAYLRHVGPGSLVAFFDPNTARAEQTCADFQQLLEEQRADQSLPAEQRAAPRLVLRPTQRRAFPHAGGCNGSDTFR